MSKRRKRSTKLDVEIEFGEDGSSMVIAIVAQDGGEVTPQAALDAVSEYFVLLDPYTWDVAVAYDPTGLN